MICSVEDDGIGREASAERNRNKPHQSKAIEITRQRLDLLERREGEDCELHISDREEGGTMVAIRLPLRRIW
jgi:hypothetical protein